MKTVTAFLTTISNRIRWLSSKLGRVPALLYLLGYLIVILVFSLVYFHALHARDFHLSTDQYEWTSTDSAGPLIRDLREAMIRAYRRNGEANRVVNGWRMLTDDLSMGSLYMGTLPSEFSFQMVVPINNGTEGNPDSSTFLGGTIAVHTDRKFISDGMVYATFDIKDPFAGPIPGIPGQIPTPGMEFHWELKGMEAPTSLPPSRDDFTQQTGGAYVLPFPLNLYNRIIDFGQSLRGLPYRVNTQYLRMLYFSAGIATSSAPGDILPVSTPARLAVTSQAVICLILIGLFLNSMTYAVAEALRSAQGQANTTAPIVADTNKKRPTKRAASSSRSAASQKGSKPPKNRASKKNPRPATRR